MHRGEVPHSRSTKARTNRACKESEGLSGRGISLWFGVRLRPCRDIFWRLWDLVFVRRIGLWKGRSSYAAWRRRCRRGGRSRTLLVGAGECRAIGRRRRRGCRRRRSVFRFLRRARLLRLWLEQRRHRRLDLSWTWRASSAGRACRLRRELGWREEPRRWTWLRLRC